MVQLDIKKEDKTMSDNINIQSQSTDPPAEPLTREEQYLSAIAGVTPSSDIPEKPLTRIERYLNKIVENGSGGSGFEPTDEQLAAMNSGITSEDVEQISTNKTNISKQQDTTAQGGNGYAIINGIRLYMEGTPTATVELLGNKWIYKSNLYECKYLLADKPLCAISTYIDTLNLTTGSCSRYIKKYVCTGEETVSEYDMTYERFFVSIPNFVTLGNRATPIISSHYQGIYDGRPISNVPMNSVYSGSVGDIGVYIKESDYTTAADFKDYLAALTAPLVP